MAVVAIKLDTTMSEPDTSFDFDVSKFNLDDFDQLSLQEPLSPSSEGFCSETSVSDEKSIESSLSLTQPELDCTTKLNYSPNSVELKHELSKTDVKTEKSPKNGSLSITPPPSTLKELKPPRKSILKPTLPPETFATRSSLIFRQGKDKMLEKLVALNLNRSPSLHVAEEFLGKELHPRDLKRVRFSFPLRSTSYIIPTSCQHFMPLEEPNRDLDNLSDLKNKKTTRQLPIIEVIDWYLTVCRLREEVPNEKFIRLLEEASETQQEITSINMSGESLSIRNIVPFADILDLLPNLTRLELEDCDMDNESLKVICSNFLLRDRITWLSLANNPKIRSEGFRSIATYINQSKNLKFLDLSCIPIDVAASKLLARSVMGKSHPSETSNLNFVESTTPTSPVFGDPSFSEDRCCLEELRLNECSLHSAELKILCQGIRRSCLQSLSLCGNRISYLSAPTIASLLTGETKDNELPSLTSQLIFLDLSSNHLRNQGLEFLLEPLSSPYLRLKELKLSRNSLNEMAMSKLFSALKTNRRLLRLDLSHNAVSGPSIEGLLSLKECLRFNHSFKSLFLSNTSMTSEGAVALAEMLPETKTLSKLDLSLNPNLHLAGLFALSVSARLNFSITCLDVSIPPNDPEMAALTQDMLNTCIRNTQMLDDLSFRA